MNCRKVRRFLWNYLEKDIDQNQREEIEFHLKGCSGCTLQAQEAVKLREIFGRTEVLRPSPDFNKKLLNRIQTEASTTRLKEVVESRPTFSWKWAFAGLAAGLVVVFVALFYQHIFNPQKPGRTISEMPALTELDHKKAQEEELPELAGYKSTRYVMDNLREAQLTRIEDSKIDRSGTARFIMESMPPSRWETRRSSNQFVLPAVSTRTVKEKSSF
jgi:hypothetical protein